MYYNGHSHYNKLKNKTKKFDTIYIHNLDYTSIIGKTLWIKEENKMENKLIIEGKEIELSQETIDNFKQQFGIKDEIIKVPDNVVIEKRVGDIGLGIGIVFKDKKQVLFFSDDVWQVSDTYPNDFINCKLEKVGSFRDIEIGEIFLRTDEYNNKDFDNLFNYAIKIKKDTYAYITNGNVSSGAVDWDNYYKVVKIGSEE